MKKKTLIIIPIVVVLLVFIGVYIYYNKEDAKTSLTVTEKKWVESNDTTMVDINVINDYPLYGLNGEGVFFSFLDDFEKNVGLEFNKIAYSKDTDLENDKTNSFRILNNEDKLNNNDLLIATDGYIAIGKKHMRINKISDFSNTTFGVFEDDVAEISYYLKQGTGLAFKSYKTIDELFNALDSDEVGMIIIPNIMYLNKTIENNTYYINYYFTEIASIIEQRLNDAGYNMILCNSNENLELEIQHIQQLKAYMVSGMIIAPTTMDFDYRKLVASQDYPIVFIDRKLSTLQGDSIIADGACAVEEAVSYLIKKATNNVVFNFPLHFFVLLSMEVFH